MIRKIRASDAGRTASLRSQGLTARQHSGDDEKCFQEAGCAFHIGNAKYPIRSRRPSSCRRPLGLLRFLARREPLGPSTRANSPAAGSQSWSLKGDGPGRSPRAAGWLSARFGRRRFFLICTVLFTVSSFLAFKAVHRRPSRVFPSDAGRYERCGITLRFFERFMIRSSVMPSAKYSWSASALKLLNGRTTIDGRTGSSNGGAESPRPADVGV